MCGLNERTARIHNLSAESRTLRSLTLRSVIEFGEFDDNRFTPFSRNYQMPKLALIITAMFLFVSSAIAVSAEITIIDRERHDLRLGDTREWSRFPANSQGPRWQTTFSAKKNGGPHTLVIRQHDVRLIWNVLLNGKTIGRLQQDENEMLSHWEIPAGTLTDGENTLAIEGSGSRSDDITIGPIHWIRSTPKSWLNEASVEIEVLQAGLNQPVSCRLTIVDMDGALVPVGAESGDQLAVRTGVVYCGNGKAKIGLPAGEYQIFAGRGLEYGRASATIKLSASDHLQKKLYLDREVDTTGWVACDTHVHTVTHSGHGDASMQERMITLAGEGIEMPVATDHNKQIDYNPLAAQLRVRDHFTPVIGNEVTTKYGHFNAFPFRADAETPDHQENDWNVLLPAIFSTPDIQVVILNHGRDTHSGYRPFDPRNFNAASGESLDGRSFRFNAMETLNSGAQQTDPLELFRDWMTLVNRGHHITPIGSSDSHDVNRYIVGQGRTYIRCDDSAPGEIDIQEACQNMREGRVVVSAGLFVDVHVDQKYGPGDLARISSPHFSVDYHVRCPNWIKATRVQLYQNGVKVRDRAIREPADRLGSWSLTSPNGDVFLSVLATGPGTRHASWPMAQPYQPDSPDWKATNLSFTGAIRIDADGDGKFSSAYDYARELFDSSNGDFSKLLKALKKHDESVAIQAAGLWQRKHGSLLDERIQSQLQKASTQTKSGFFRYLSAWRTSQKSLLLNP